MVGGFGIWELIIILVIVMVLFGAKRLPELAKGLGQGITEFKKAQKSTEDEPPSAQTTSTEAGNTKKDL
ncbi:MAG: twin-arginine translocase TatA/TatE family subunit [Gemmatimonadota bacterium]|nr:twin-arginine translocase TatA/TatE family subunit [Gemmatimonadota bacterium]